jgi:hypothetical protein
MSQRSGLLNVSVVAILAFLSMPFVSGPTADAAGFPAAGVNAVLGAKGGEMPGGVYRYGWPRSDLDVKLGDVKLQPALALGSWAGFIPTRKGAMMMGDLVLLESEVAPVIKELHAHAIMVTAIHNHLLHESPRLTYVHYMGLGDPIELAKGLKAALKRTRTPLESPSISTPAAAGIPSWVADVENALGHKGKWKGEVCGVSVTRSDQITVDGEVIPPAMGVAIAMNLQAAVGNKVASTGDFVLTAAEIDPVMKELQKRGIKVTALHNHMLDDSPHLFFLHYWAVGKPADVAVGLKAALALVNVQHAK